MSEGVVEANGKLHTSGLVPKKDAKKKAPKLLYEIPNYFVILEHIDFQDTTYGKIVKFIDKHGYTFHPDKVRSHNLTTKVGTDENGKFYYLGHLNKNSKRTGAGICFYESGLFYEGKWDKDEFSGDGTLMDGDQTYRGQFKDGLQHGFGTLYQKNCDGVNGCWGNGELLRDLHIDTMSKTEYQEIVTLKQSKDHDNQFNKWFDPEPTKIEEEVKQVKSTPDYSKEDLQYIKNFRKLTHQQRDTLVLDSENQDCLNFVYKFAKNPPISRIKHLHIHGDHSHFFQFLRSINLHRFDSLHIHRPTGEDKTKYELSKAKHGHIFNLIELVDIHLSFNGVRISGRNLSEIFKNITGLTGTLEFINCKIYESMFLNTSLLHDCSFECLHLNRALKELELEHFGAQLSWMSLVKTLKEIHVNGTNSTVIEKALQCLKAKIVYTDTN